jgi:hypothetical protein
MENVETRDMCIDQLPIGTASDASIESADQLESLINARLSGLKERGMLATSYLFRGRIDLATLVKPNETQHNIKDYVAHGINDFWSSQDKKNPFFKSVGKYENGLLCTFVLVVSGFSFGMDYRPS